MKIFRFVIALAIAPLFITSCATFGEESPDADSKKSRIIACTERASRTTMGNNYSVLWSDGDLIAVFGFMNDHSEPSAEIYQLVSGVGSANGVFEGGLPSNFDIYSAIYPISMFQAMSYSGQILLELPYDNAVYTEQNFLDEANPMYAVGTLEGGFKFKNLCGILELKVNGTGTISAIRVEADSAISGSFLVQNGEAVLYRVQGYDAYNYVAATISPAITLSTDTARSIYVILPPKTYSNLKITTTDTAGGTTTLTAANPITITRSAITPVSIFTHDGNGEGGGDDDDGGDSGNDGDNKIEDPEEKPEIDW